MRKSNRESKCPSTSKGAKTPLSSQKASPAIGGAGPAKKMAKKSQSGPTESDLVQLSVRALRDVRQAVRQTALERKITVQQLVILALQSYGVPVGKMSKELGAAGAATTPPVPKSEDCGHSRSRPATDIDTGGAELVRAITDLALVLLGHSSNLQKPFPTSETISSL